MVHDSRLGVLPMTDQAKMWQNLILRLQSCAYRECRGHALAIVSVKLVVRDGELARWSKPMVTHMEPGGYNCTGAQGEVLEDWVMEALTSS